jgi:PAS domain S-box-containing protein
MDALVPEWILNSLSEGVIVLDDQGAVLAANPALERLLAVRAEEVIGQPFAAVFVADESLDEFVQAVLDAAYHADTVQNRVFWLRPEQHESRAIAVTTSLLCDPRGLRIGVVALLNDITELEALREQERALNTELTEANRALGESYRTLETRNQELTALTRQVTLVRSLATGFVFVFFVGIGFYTWNLGNQAPASSAPAVAAKATAGAARTLRVTPSPHRVSLKLVGHLEPIATVNLVAALDGTIAERFVEYGQSVTAGDSLFTIASEPARVHYREARSGYLGALEELERLQAWDASAEMQRARRGLTRAESNLQTLERKAGETRRLLELGIVPASELESAEEQMVAARMEVAQAREELASTSAQGAEDKVTVARLKLENAEYQMREWERKLAETQVVAPVDGVVMAPDKTKEGGGESNFDVGALVKEGVAVLAIGDMTGLAVRAAVDELEIARLRPGLPAVVTGEAFPGQRLEGQVARVSAQANPAQGRAAPTFDILVEVRDLGVEQRSEVRVGMTARTEIIVEDAPEALMIPLSAVNQGPEGPRVRVRLDGEDAWVPVTLGPTALDSVRVLDGLRPGMEILLAP